MLNDNQRYTMRGQTVYTEGQVQRRIDSALASRPLKQPTQEEMYRETLKFLGISELNSASTPSSNWSVKGEPDFHPDLINKERGSLMLGDHTDDELANAVFMYGNPSDREKHQRLMKGEILDIAYLTAAKERIRWLSRHLELALSKVQMQENVIKNYESKPS